MTPPRSITLFTSRYPEETGEAVRRLLDQAGAGGILVRVPANEAEKHGIEARDGVEVGADPGGDTDLAVVLGGDGSILRALGTYVGRDVPVFAFNFGAIGFLSTVDHGEVDDGIRRILAGDFDVVPMPVLAIDTREGTRFGVNDVSFHRRPSGRVAELAYSVEGEQVGKVRCDGLVASTPQGSTGYNLANGGPLLAWGVEGFIVSFISPHSLTARALVVAPDSLLTVQNVSESEALDVTTDGRTVCALAPGEAMDIRFEHDRALLAQVPNATFYHRLREKFGRIAT